MDKILKQDTRCSSCHEMMFKGDLFIWGTKKVYTTGRVSDPGKTVYKPIHPSGTCVLDKFKESERQYKITCLTEMLTNLGYSKEDIQKAIENI